MQFLQEKSKIFGYDSNFREKPNLPFVSSATANMYVLQKITSFALSSRNMSCSGEYDSPILVIKELRSNSYLSMAAPCNYKKVLVRFFYFLLSCNIQTFSEWCHIVTIKNLSTSTHPLEGILQRSNCGPTNIQLTSNPFTRKAIGDKLSFNVDFH